MKLPILVTPRRLYRCIVLLALLQPGCTRQAERAQGDAKKGDAEAEVRLVFADFQAAVKARDGTKLWGLLAEESRQDADRKAKGVKDDFNKADDKQKAELEKKIGRA